MNLLQLIGGPLDGLHLPVHPRFDRAPSVLAIDAMTLGWLRYEWKESGDLATCDVCRIDYRKIPPTVPKRGSTVTNLDYTGPMPADEVKEILKEARRQQREDSE